MNEYVKCLSEADLKLSKQEIIALAVSADTDNNGEIAYEEFMKHFNHVLKMIKVHRALSNAIVNIEANKWIITYSYLLLPPSLPSFLPSFLTSFLFQPFICLDFFHINSTILFSFWRFC